MKSYRFAAHTSDTRLIAEAGDLESLFQAALDGMNCLIRQDTCEAAVDLPERITISLEADDTSVLLIDFLSEILSYSHLNKCMYCQAKFSVLKETSLAARIYGIKVDRFDRDVKAVTYHEAEVIRDMEGNYRTVIIFDV